MNAETPEANRSEIVVECLRDAGWNPQIAPDGGIGVGVPLGQEDQYESDSETCWALVHSPPFDEISAQDREIYYGQLVELRECIIGLGIELPVAPTFQAWVDMDGAWSPYGDFRPSAFPERIDGVKTNCPQIGP